MLDISPARLRHAEYIIIACIIGFVAIMAITSFYAGGSQILQRLASISWPFISILLLLSLANYFLRAYRWHIFSKHLHVNVPFKSTVLYYFSGFSMTTTPGKLGEAMRLWFLERCHNYDYARVGPLFVGDRLSDMITLMILILIGLTSFSNYLGITLLAFSIIFALTFLFLRPSMLIAFTGTLYKWSGKRWRRIFARIRRTLRLTTTLFSWRIFVSTLIITSIGWLAECAAFYLLLHELGTEVSFIYAMFVFSFSMIAGAMSLLPGGLGGVEATMIALLVAAGINLDVAIVATTVIRLTTLWFAVFIGFMALPFAMKKVRALNQAKWIGSV